MLTSATARLMSFFVQHGLRKSIVQLSQFGLVANGWWSYVIYLASQLCAWLVNTL